MIISKIYTIKFRQKLIYQNINPSTKIKKKQKYKNYILRNRLQRLHHKLLKNQKKSNRNKILLNQNKKQN